MSKVTPNTPHLPFQFVRELYFFRTLSADEIKIMILSMLLLKGLANKNYEERQKITFPLKTFQQVLNLKKKDSFIFVSSISLMKHLGYLKAFSTPFIELKTEQLVCTIEFNPNCFPADEKKLCVSPKRLGFRLEEALVETNSSIKVRFMLFYIAHQVLPKETNEIVQLSKLLCCSESAARDAIRFVKQKIEKYQ